MPCYLLLYYFATLLLCLATLPLAKTFREDYNTFLLEIRL